VGCRGCRAAGCPNVDAAASPGAAQPPQKLHRGGATPGRAQRPAPPDARPARSGAATCRLPRADADQAAAQAGDRHGGGLRCGRRPHPAHGLRPHCKEAALHARCRAAQARGAGLRALPGAAPPLCQALALARASTGAAASCALLQWPSAAAPPPPRAQIAADNAVFGQSGPKVGSFDAGYGSTQMVSLARRRRRRSLCSPPARAAPFAPRC
jgi:hypothetical protein